MQEEGRTRIKVIRPVVRRFPYLGRADTRQSAPCPSTLDPQSPACLTGASTPHLPLAWYTSSDTARGAHGAVARAQARARQRNVDLTYSQCDNSSLQSFTNNSGHLHDGVHKGGNCAWLGPVRCECRPAGVCGRGTFVLQHGAERPAGCE